MVEICTLTLTSVLLEDMNINLSWIQSKENINYAFSDYIFLQNKFRELQFP